MVLLKEHAGEVHAGNPKNLTNMLPYPIDIKVYEIDHTDIRVPSC